MWSSRTTPARAPAPRGVAHGQGREGERCRHGQGCAGTIGDTGGSWSFARTAPATPTPSCRARRCRHPVVRLQRLTRGRPRSHSLTSVPRPSVGAPAVGVGAFCRAATRDRDRTPTTGRAARLVGRVDGELLQAPPAAPGDRLGVTGRREHGIALTVRAPSAGCPSSLAWRRAFP